MAARNTTAIDFTIMFAYAAAGSQVVRLLSRRGALWLDRICGAVLLALTNVTCINLAAVATFLLQRVRPRTWWEAERAKRATRLAATTWVVMLLLLLALMVLTRIVPADLAR